MNTSQESFLEEHVDSAVIPIPRSRDCPSRLHPMHWHKNNHVQAGQRSMPWCSQPTLNVQDNDPGSICRDISTEYPSGFGTISVRWLHVVEFLTFLDRFWLSPPKKTILSFYKPLLPTISCGKHFHSLTTYLMKNYLFFWTLSSIFLFVLSFPVLVLEESKQLFYFHFLQASHDFTDIYSSPFQPSLFMLILYQFDIFCLVG